MWLWFLVVFIPLCRSLICCCYSYFQFLKCYLCLGYGCVHSTLSLGLPWYMSESLSQHAPWALPAVSHCCLNVCQSAWWWGLESECSVLILNHVGTMPPGLGVGGCVWSSKFLSSPYEQFWTWHIFLPLPQDQRFGFYSVVFPQFQLDLSAF